MVVERIFYLISSSYLQAPSCVSIKGAMCFIGDRNGDEAR